MPKIDNKICEKCGTCAMACPYKAISYDEKKDIYVIDENKCQKCGRCIAVCPLFALSKG